MGYGGMGYGMGGTPFGMGGYGASGASAEPVKPGANFGGPRAAWAETAEAGAGPAESLPPEPAVPDTFTMLDDSFRAQLMHLRNAAARHRRALQETYFSASRSGATRGVRGLDPSVLGDAAAAQPGQPAPAAPAAQPATSS